MRNHTIRTRPLWVSCVLLLACASATAAATPQREQRSVSGAPATSPERFGQHGDNYALYNTMRNNGWAGHDESAVRAHYSLKFTFCGPKFSRSRPVANEPDDPTRTPTLCPQGEKSSQLELFAAYTGEFDFYAGTRESGPVVNRVSNPGLFVRIPLRLYLPSLAQGDDHAELGIEHRSNGQVGDVTSARGTEAAQRAYQARDRQFFDAISRGADYISLSARLFDRFGDDRVELRSKLRLYLNQDAAVTWGPLANAGRRFSDYDRLQLMGAIHPRGWGRWELQWRVGDRGLATDSFDLGWQAESKSFPLYIRLHRGPMNTLSNYTQRQDSVGIGIRFATFQDQAR